MSAKKLTITDATGTVKGAFNVRYEKLDRDETPKIIHKVGDVEVNSRAIHNGVVLLEGMTRKGWVDGSGKEYQRDEIKHYYEGTEVTEKAQTTTFEIIAYQPISSYTDSYVIAKYYEIFPDDDNKRKDFERNIARQRNLAGMRSLWEHLRASQSVARGEFNVSSSGFLSTDGYCRALSFGSKWGIEVGIFKEEKLFKHLQNVVSDSSGKEVQGSSQNPVRIKRV